jgi:hypothetical protein
VERRRRLAHVAHVAHVATSPTSPTLPRRPRRTSPRRMRTLATSCPRHVTPTPRSPRRPRPVAGTYIKIHILTGSFSNSWSKTWLPRANLSLTGSRMGYQSSVEATPMPTSPTPSCRPRPRSPPPRRRLTRGSSHSLKRSRATGRLPRSSRLQMQDLEFNWFLLSFWGQYRVSLDERLKTE